MEQNKVATKTPGTLWFHQTWLAGKSPNWMEVFIGPFSSMACLMTPEGKRNFGKYRSGKMIWLVVYLPLWKIWKSIRMIIPNIWKNKSHVPNHQTVISLHAVMAIIRSTGCSSCWSFKFVPADKPETPKCMLVIKQPYYYIYIYCTCMIIYIYICTHGIYPSTYDSVYR